MTIMFVRLSPSERRILASLAMSDRGCTAAVVNRPAFR